MIVSLQDNSLDLHVIISDKFSTQTTPLSESTTLPLEVSHNPLPSPTQDISSDNVIVHLTNISNPTPISQPPSPSPTVKITTTDTVSYVSGEMVYFSDLFQNQSSQVLPEFNWTIDVPESGELNITDVIITIAGMLKNVVPGTVNAFTIVTPTNEIPISPEAQSTYENALTTINMGQVML